MIVSYKWLWHGEGQKSFKGQERSLSHAACVLCTQLEHLMCVTVWHSSPKLGWRNQNESPFWSPIYVSAHLTNLSPHQYFLVQFQFKFFEQEELPAWNCTNLDIFVDFIMVNNYYKSLNFTLQMFTGIYGVPIGFSCNIYGKGL